MATGLLAGRFAAALALDENTSAGSSCIRTGLADPLHHQRQSETLPARQHCLRPVAGPGRGHPQTVQTRQESPPRRGLPPGHRRDGGYV
ncbi:MAG: hypothetical protein QM757_24140 [Paludibaculum sp.]